MTSTTLINTQADPFVSVIMQAVADIAKSRGETVDVRRTAATEGEKGSIILDLAIGVAGGAVWDMMYAAILRFRNRKDYNRSLKITIDGQEVTIEQIENGKRA